MKVLHASAECFPLAKTGGLGDVVFALPAAQRRMGIDARVVLPGYRGTRERLQQPREVLTFQLRGHLFRAVEGLVSDRSDRPALPIILLESPKLFDRAGTDLYRNSAGAEWHDNGFRFGCFAEAVARLALTPGFVPDVLHLHDWQAALAAAWASRRARRPRLVYTIHNLAYQGQYGRALFDALGLPPALWTVEGAEFWGGFSFMKAGLTNCDVLTTVSPTYAREIQTPEFGCGLEGVLRDRADILEGVLNGVDLASWDPRHDPFISRPYDAQGVADGKRHNRSAVRAELGLADVETPLVVWLGRMVEQKGADLILAARDALAAMDLQIVILGMGDAPLEHAFTEFARAFPDGRASTRIAYDERLAHRLTAGADILLMPSRYEPCGLNQMYAQRYGTIPVVRRTGGLADTVVDATAATLAAGTASGVQFRDADPGGLTWGVRRGLELHANEQHRASLRAAGMGRDFSWDASARTYSVLYERPLPP